MVPFVLDHHGNFKNALRAISFWIAEPVLLVIQIAFGAPHQITEWEDVNQSDGLDVPTQENVHAMFMEVARNVLMI